MMAAESPLSLPPSPAKEDLEILSLDDDEEEQASTSSPFAPRVISTARSELNGGDPLLNPPLTPSPPSSPSSSTAYFSSPSSTPTPPTPQKIQNGGSERHVPEFTRISVTDPLKEIDPNPSLAGSSTYVSYLITAKSVNEGREFRVRRRFRDVVTLADRLADSYRGYFIPARPDKSVVEGQVLQLSY